MMAWIVQAAIVLLAGVSLMTARTVPVFDLSNTRTFTDGLKYYRYLNMDETNNVLYVGALEHVYRLNPDDIANTGGIYHKSISLPARSDDLVSCSFKYDSLVCRNHIRVIVVQEDQIYVCGTGAHYPMEFTLTKSDLSPVLPYPTDDRNSGVKKCPPKPDDAYTAVYVENDNPSQIPSLYAATPTNINNRKQVFYRPELLNGASEISQSLQTEATTVNVPNKWLKEAEFVASFVTREYVYVFFNEIAVEYSATWNVPRVARVCKNDLGGAKQTLLDEHWTSFVKVRLNCSLPDAVPFYFDYLRDVRRMGNIYYGLFTTPENSMNGSAVCHFTQEEIDNAFMGTFIEYNENMGWVEVEDSQVPTQRPGMCSNNSLNLENSVLNFIYSHPLMYNALGSHLGQPIHYCPLMVADKLIVKTTTGRNNEMFIIFYLITATGDMQKIAYSPSRGQTKVVLELRPFLNQDTIVRAALNYGDHIYLSTDEEIKQVSVEQCFRYNLCTDCVQDPHCGWQTYYGECQPYSAEHLQSVFEDPLQNCADAGACFTSVENHEVRVPGDAVHLSCSSQCGPNDGSVQQWFHNNYPVTLDTIPLKYVLTSEHGLVLLNTTQMDAGSYECRVDNYLLKEHQVDVPDCQASDEGCIWKNEFRNWCAAFDDYRINYNQWVCLKDECVEGNCEPEQLTQCSAP